MARAGPRGGRMRVYEIAAAEFASLMAETAIATESQSGAAHIHHGTHSGRGEVVLIRIGAAHFLVEADDVGSPLGQLLTQLEKL